MLSKDVVSYLLYIGLLRQHPILHYTSNNDTQAPPIAIVLDSTVPVLYPCLFPFSECLIAVMVN